MKKSRFSEEQIIGVLKEADAGPTAVRCRTTMNCASFMWP
jgi:hypothetical protein